MHRCLKAELEGDPSSIPPSNPGPFIHSGSPEPKRVQTESSKELVFLKISGKISKTKPLSEKAPLHVTTGRMNRQWNVTLPMTPLPSNSPVCSRSLRGTLAASANIMSLSSYKMCPASKSSPTSTVERL